MPNVVRQIVRAGMAVALPRHRFMVSGPRSANAVCLTFDDGPHPEHTPRLLDVLREQGAKATFFMIGREVEKYPHLVRRAIDEGHAVGGHSFSHGNPTTTSARELSDEAERTEQLFEQVLGRRVLLFRPPHGKLTAAKILHLWRAGQSVVLWNVDPKDYNCMSPRDLINRLTTRMLVGGDVVLLHDNMPHAIEALPEVLESARRRGLSFVTAESWVRRVSPSCGRSGRAVASAGAGCRVLAMGGAIRLMECVTL